jgi:HEAT repeat protein
MGPPGHRVRPRPGSNAFSGSRRANGEVLAVGLRMDAGVTLKSEKGREEMSKQIAMDCLVAAVLLIAARAGASPAAAEPSKSAGFVRFVQIHESFWQQHGPISVANGEKLLPALRSPADPTVKQDAIVVLGDAAERGLLPGPSRALAFAAVAGRLRSSNDLERYAAVLSLGQMRDRRALPLLRRALKDRSEGVREGAGRSLAKLGSLPRASAPGTH